MIEFELKKWQVDYRYDLAQYANNEEIGKNLRDGFPYPYTVEDADAYIQSCIKNEGDNQICRAITVDGHVVGSIGVFRGNNVHRRTAEMGYWLAEEYWNKGIMSRAIRQLSKKVFEQTDIVRIYAEPFSSNDASKRVLEKAGFTLEGIMRKAVYKDGEYYDFYMYSIIK